MPGTRDELEAGACTIRSKRRRASAEPRLQKGSRRPLLAKRRQRARGNSVGRGDADQYVAGPPPFRGAKTLEGAARGGKG
ncbi:hypothetical protein MTO96_009566 [Rhipicephalus appendiculatus]